MKQIKNDQDYEKALHRIEQLIDISPELDTKQSNELESLALLIEKYEDIHYPLPFKGGII